MKTKLQSICRLTVTVVMIVLLGNVLRHVFEANNFPEPLPVELQTASFEPRLAKIIDDQWRRDGSVPSAGDIAAYETLLADMSRVDYQQIGEEGKRVDALETYASNVLSTRLERRVERYQWLQPKIGTAAATVIVASDLGVDAAHYRRDKLHVRAFRLAHQRGVRASAHYHFAMALHFQGDNSKAILELVKVMEETPEHAKVNDMYIIAGRLQAGDNQLFIDTFTKIGGSIERLRKDYDGTQKLHPSYVVQGADYEVR